MRISDKIGCYGSPVLIVSEPALAEMRASFRETGYAYGGTGALAHPDWSGVADALLGVGASGTSLCHCETDSGRTAGIGSIRRFRGEVSYSG